MSTKLSTPIPIKTRYGIVQATHLFHSVHVHDRPDGVFIQSTKTFGIDVDGALSEIQEGSEAITISGADASALGDQFTMADVSTVHDTISTRRKQDALNAAKAEAQRLQTQIDQANDALAGIKSASPSVTIGTDTPGQ